MGCPGHERGCIILGSQQVCVPFRPKSYAKDPQDRIEEDMQFGAVDTLEDVRTRAGVPGMMEALRYIAKHYGLDKDKILRQWAKHHGPTLVMEALKNDGHPCPACEALRLFGYLGGDDD